MYRRLAQLLAIGAAMAAATVLGAPSASAQQTVTVTNPDPGGSFTAYSDRIVLRQGGNVIAECLPALPPPGGHASEAVGALPSAPYEAPAHVGSVDTLTFSCRPGPLGPIGVTPGGLPYAIVITSYDSALDQAHGYIGSINLHLTMSGCAFDVIGQAGGVYDNLTAEWRMGDLEAPVPFEVSNVEGCFGFVNPGPASLEGTYEISPNITIRSP